MIQWAELSNANTLDCQWHQEKWNEESFVADNLNIHKPEYLVRYVADVSDLDIDLGIKGKSDILQSIETHESFLGDMPIPLKRS